MAGNQLGALKSKLGLKGVTKPGDMLTKLNAMKAGAMKKSGTVKTKGKKLIKKII